MLGYVESGDYAVKWHPLPVAQWDNTMRPRGLWRGLHNQCTNDANRPHGAGTSPIGGALLLHPPLQKQQLPRRHGRIAAESSAGILIGRRLGGTRSSVGGGAIRLAGGAGKGGQLDATKVGLLAQPARAVQAAKSVRALRIGRLRVGGDGGLPAHRGARLGFGDLAQGGHAGGELGMIGGAVLHALDPSGAEQRGGEQRQGQQAPGPWDQAGHTIPGV